MQLLVEKLRENSLLISTCRQRNHDCHAGLQNSSEGVNYLFGQPTPLIRWCWIVWHPISFQLETSWRSWSLTTARRLLLQYHWYHGLSGTIMAKVDSLISGSIVSAVDLRDLLSSEQSSHLQDVLLDLSTARSSSFEPFISASVVSSYWQSANAFFLCLLSQVLFFLFIVFFPSQ